MYIFDALTVTALVVIGLYAVVLTVLGHERPVVDRCNVKRFTTRRHK